MLVILRLLKVHSYHMGPFLLLFRLYFAFDYSTLKFDRYSLVCLAILPLQSLRTIRIHHPLIIYHLQLFFAILAVDLLKVRQPH